MVTNMEKMKSNAPIQWLIMNYFKCDELLQRAIDNIYNNNNFSVSISEKMKSSICWLIMNYFKGDELLLRAINDIYKVSFSVSISENIENKNGNKRKLKAETPISNKKINSINNEPTHKLLLLIGDKIKEPSDEINVSFSEISKNNDNKRKLKDETQISNKRIKNSINKEAICKE
jgi:hypothetical protein